MPGTVKNLWCRLSLSMCSCCFAPSPTNTSTCASGPVVGPVYWHAVCEPAGPASVGAFNFVPASVVASANGSSLHGSGNDCAPNPLGSGSLGEAETVTVRVTIRVTVGPGWPRPTSTPPGRESNRERGKTREASNLQSSRARGGRSFARCHLRVGHRCDSAGFQMVNDSLGPGLRVVMGLTFTALRKKLMMSFTGLEIE